MAKFALVLITIAVGVLVLTGCTSNPIVAGSSVRVAVDETFTSLNPSTSYGRGSATNADVAYLTGAGFGYVDDAGATVDDPSFGRARIVARDPLTVTYTVADDARWSDGAPVDAADLLLAWAANSGVLNTPRFDDSSYIDSSTGRYTKPFPPGVVYFDGTVGSGLERVTRFPQLSDDGRSITVHYDSFLAGWKLALGPGLPAHVVAREALGLAKSVGDGDAEKRLVAAVQQKDTAGLARIARFWDDAYNVGATPKDPALLVAAGPYRVARVATGSVTLIANPQYRGTRQPRLQTIELRVSPDPLETVKLLRSGAVDVVSPQPSKDVIAALHNTPGVTVAFGSEDVFEHLDLQFTNSKDGTFTDQRVREAFLDVVPRQQIVDQLIAPLQRGAKILDSFVLRPGGPGYAAAVAHNGSRAYRGDDVGAARKLLAQAGMPDPEVCILYEASNPRRAAEFRLIQQSAAPAGFRVTDCSRSDWSGFLGVPGAYDAALFAWDTTRLGPATVGAVFRSDAKLANFSGYSDPSADALIDQLAAADDPDAQTRLLGQLDGRLWADAYGMPLFGYPTVTAVDDRVSGVTRSPLARSVFWNAWTWKPAASAGPAGAEPAGKP